MNPLKNENRKDPLRALRIQHQIADKPPLRASRGANEIKTTLSNILRWGSGKAIRGMELGKITSFSASHMNHSININWQSHSYPARITVRTEEDEIQAKLPAMGAATISVNNQEVAVEDTHHWLEKIAMVLEMFEAGLDQGEITPY